MSAARAAFNAAVAEPDQLPVGPPDSEAAGHQRPLSDKLETRLFQQLLSQAAPAGQARLRSVAAPHAGAWLQALPSNGLGQRLTHQEFAAATRLRLGCTVLPQDQWCPLCDQVLDSAGTHCLACMAGGHALTCHNEVRDYVYLAALRAGLNPRWAVITLGLFGVGLGFVLMQKYARGAWLEQLAMAAVIGRLTGYHRAVDNVMMVFLLVLLAVHACEEPRNRWLAALFLAVGLSLWVPVRANWMLPQICSMVVWPAALAALLIHQNRAQRFDKGDGLCLDKSGLEESGQTAG